MADTDITKQFKLLIEVDGPNLQLDAAEPLLKQVLSLLLHPVKASHPDQSVDGNTLLAAAERAIPQLP
jgi:hypothetical protein